MENPPTHPPVRSKILRALRLPAAVVGLAVLYVLVIGIVVDVTPQGKEIAGTLGAALGREVRLDGAVQLEISARPKLRMDGLRIANARGFDADDFARLGKTRLALNLWPLLWGHLRVEELASSDAHLRLQMRKEGDNNWTFRKTAPADDPATPATAPTDAFARIDIQRISLQNVDVEYVGGDAAPHYFTLTSLVARVPSDGPVTLSLNGTVEKSFPYRLEFTGGTASDLFAADRPWPVSLSLTFLSSQLTLKGSVSGASGNLHFAVATNDLGEFERLLQTRLPPVGHTHVEGDLAFAPGTVKLSGLNGNVGSTALDGALFVDYGGPRPRISGELALPVLDLRPFMTGKRAEDDAPAQSLAEIYRDLAQATFDLHALNGVDADLSLRVGYWLNFPNTVRDAQLQVKLSHGRLDMPIRATLADVTVSGSALVDARKGPARFEVTLGARDSGIGHLADLLPGAPEVKGHLGRFDLRLSARGNHGAELMSSLVVRLGLERAHLSWGDTARPVQVSLDQFAVELPAGQPLHGEAHGNLVGSAFNLSLNGAPLTQILQQDNAAIDFTVRAGSASAQVHALLQPPTRDSGSDIRFSLDAPHSSEISGWLGLRPGADAPVNLKGRFETREDGWLLSGLVFQLGHSRLSAEARQTRENRKPLVQLQLSGDVIDADELKSLLPDSPPVAPARATPASAAMIDIPVLPQGINLGDADITVRIRDVVTRSPFAVHDLRFDGRIRDGMMAPSPFAARVANADFSGVILLDLRSQQPRAELWLGADGVDIGRVLHGLDMAHNTEAGIDHLRLHINLHSSRLGQLLAQSEFSLSFDGGHLELKDSNTGGAMHIALTSGELKSAPGVPVRLSLDGALDKAPVKIDIQTATAADLVNPALSIPFALNASFSDATLKLSGDVDRPFSQQDVELALEMRGRRFDNLNPLVRASLPPWGPWSASGKFHMSSAGYEVSSLLLQVGSSRLTGHGKLDTKAMPPRLDVELAAPVIQIDDFRLGNWSAEAKSAPTRADSAPAGDSGADAQQLLSREMLRRQNASLVVRVDHVLSGTDVLGDGKLEVTLQDGRAQIGPAIVHTPGGNAMVRLDYEPGEKDVALNFQAEARHFDYGILARRIDKASDMRGTFDLDVNVSARAQRVADLMRYGKGHVDFALWPENLKSGLLDMWAVNVIMALLPAVDSSSESRVNCAIGEFRLQDGKLAQKRILIDTTRMRVTGKGNVDFTTGQLGFYMQPRSKTPQFLSFPLPVELSGSFDDFSVGVRAGDVLGTAGQLVTSVLWVPLQSLFGKSLPPDGGDVCRP